MSVCPQFHHHLFHACLVHGSSICRATFYANPPLLDDEWLASSKFQGSLQLISASLGRSLLPNRYRCPLACSNMPRPW